MNPRFLPVTLALVAFGVYSCMYAFRKPYTAATFGDWVFLGMDYKVWLVIAQTLGYALSKFIGIKFIAELRSAGRMGIILGLIGMAWAALLGFALTPAPYNIGFLFINGIPLGMVFGVVFSYLEGRRSTEFLGAVLAASFIFSSGFVKSAGKWLMNTWQVNEFWMPFATGGLFAAPTLLLVWLLDRTPPPDEDDIARRSVRLPMQAAARRDFLRTFRTGIVLMTLTYIILTLLRDVRDNFAAEVWKELGYAQSAAIFTRTEIPVTLAILGLMSLLVLVKDNFRALALNHGFILSGFLVAIASTLLFRQGLLSAPWWFMGAGLGLYLGYVPFNCLLFDRLLASFRYPGNVGFLMYIVDAFGYLGSVSILFFKETGKTEISWSAFLGNILLYLSLAGLALTALSLQYFRKKHQIYIQN